MQGISGNVRDFKPASPDDRYLKRQRICVSYANITILIYIIYCSTKIIRLQPKIATRITKPIVNGYTEKLKFRKTISVP
jgi:hypothetical protein